MCIKKIIRKTIILLIIISTVFCINTNTYAQDKTTDEATKTDSCKGGIKLNTNVPFIWRCIQLKEAGKNNNKEGNAEWTTVTPISAFPILMGGLTKIMLTLILSISFLLVIAAGTMMIMWWANKSYYDKWLKLLKTVATTLIVIWLSWIILRLINPNFFWI